MNDSLIVTIKETIGYTEEGVSCGTCVHHAESERSGVWGGQCYLASGLVVFNVDSEGGHCERWELKQ
jgi:hypothetical protein